MMETDKTLPKSRVGLPKTTTTSSKEPE